MPSAPVPVAADYVVVGGGTAGCVVAERLSEDPDARVLLLESGHNRNDDPKVLIPALWTTLIGTEVDWQLKTVPQPGLDNRVIQQPQGKVLGGSSAINGLAFIASSRAVINAWSKLGNPTWGWESLLPYYKKFYNLILPDEATREHLDLAWFDESVTGKDGPIQVSFPGTRDNPIGKAWVDTFKSIGYETNADPFSGTSIGGYSNAATIDPVTKKRSFAGSAYAVPALENSNFALLTGATVQKILLRTTPTGVIAQGVEALIEGQICHIQARKEVILAAGAFHTPKLLELSGIGNERILARHGIRTIIHNPGVGENLQDHLLSGISLEVNDGLATNDALLRNDEAAIARARELYNEHQTGPLCIGGIECNAFMPIMDFADTPEGQDRQKELFDMCPPLDKASEEHYYTVRAILEEPGEASASVFSFLAQANLHQSGETLIGDSKALQSGNYISLGCIQSLPFSRGSTHISSSHPEDKPIIDPCYFSHPLDLEIMSRHLQSMDILAGTETLKHFITPNGRRNHPDAHRIRDFEVAKKYLRDTARTAYHNCGTAAMLPRDKGGVVNEKLLVYGTTNLRIVDASVFPLIPRANIITTVYAVAEKAADIIKHD